MSVVAPNRYHRDLNAEGYKFFPAQISPFRFSVVKPNGTIYQVDLIAGTCDCEAGKRGVNCCHRKEAAKRAGAQQHQQQAQQPATKVGFGSREAFLTQRAQDFD